MTDTPQRNDRLMTTTERVADILVRAAEEHRTPDAVRPPTHVLVGPAVWQELHREASRARFDVLVDVLARGRGRICGALIILTGDLLVGANGIVPLWHAPVTGQAARHAALHQAARIADAVAERCHASARKARAADKVMVESHRESDASTAEAIAHDIRKLLPPHEAAAELQRSVAEVVDAWEKRTGLRAVELELGPRIPESAPTVAATVQEADPA